MATPVCGIDFSTKALHVALLGGPTLVSVKRHALGDTVAAGVGVITKLAIGLHETYGPLTVFTEEPWMGMNVQTLVKLTLIVGRVEGIFVASGHVVERIAPETWRSIVGVTGKDRAAKKASAIRVARWQFPGFTITDDDTADAIGLALYGRQVQRRDDIVARAAG